jgi:hypothetical protein
MVDWGILGAAICRVNEETQVERKRGRWSRSRICYQFVSVIQLLEHEAVTGFIRGDRLNKLIFGKQN